MRLTPDGLSEFPRTDYLPGATQQKPQSRKLLGREMDGCRSAEERPVRFKAKTRK
jgi:hypothetical protein